jgi:hypothetical protein
MPSMKSIELHSTGRGYAQETSFVKYTDQYRSFIVFIMTIEMFMAVRPWGNSFVSSKATAAAETCIR